MSVVTATSEVLDAGDTRAQIGETPRFIRRLIRRPVAVACLTYLVLLIGVAVVAPLVLPEMNHEQAGNLLAVHQGPSSRHLLGTDTVGRDVLDRLLVGTRVTLIAVGEALVVFLVLGIPLGLVAGFFGGPTDHVVTWLADLAFAMPGLILVLVVLSVFPQNTLAAMVTFGVLASPFLIRIVRSATLPVRHELYIASARVSGLSRPYIVSRHVLPRVSGAIIVQAALFCGAALLCQAGLAFLGLLVAPPAPSWGGMLNDGTQNIILQPWLIWPPGIAIALTILVFGLLGDAARDSSTEGWQPSMRRGGKRGRDRGAFGRRVMAVPTGVARTFARRPGSANVDEAVRQQLKGTKEAGGGGVTAPPPSEGSILRFDSVSVSFPSDHGRVPILDDVCFSVGAGEIVGIVGESGCGKTMTAKAILGLLPNNAEVSQGQILFQGRDLASLDERELRDVRGKEVALISQEPMISLNPAFRIGWQLSDCVRLHHGLARKAARQRALDLLALVQLPDPERVANSYPHELSGGMAQRVAIARALAGEPKLLIADEPTTALDVTVQSEILDLLRLLSDERGMAVLLVTHDWGVVADICERAIVMYAGQVVETSQIVPLFREPLHPYTRALLESNPHHAPVAEFLPTIDGAVPELGHWPTGCHFSPRCPLATQDCRDSAVALEDLGSGRATRCIHHRALITPANVDYPRSRARIK